MPGKTRHSGVVWPKLVHNGCKPGCCQSPPPAVAVLCRLLPTKKADVAQCEWRSPSLEDSRPARLSFRTGDVCHVNALCTTGNTAFARRRAVRSACHRRQRISSVRCDARAPEDDGAPCSGGPCGVHATQGNGLRAVGAQCSAHAMKSNGFLGAAAPHDARVTKGNGLRAVPVQRSA